MQGLADGYFVIPYTIGDYLANNKLPKVTTEHDAFKACVASVKDQTARLLAIKGDKTVRDYHWELGRIMWDNVGMGRTAKGLTQAISDMKALREDYWKNVKVGGTGDDLNKSLEFAGRVADFIELGELMARDALERNESCGGHFREEYQTPEGEALRNDEEYCHVAAWEFTGEGSDPKLNKEPLTFESVHLAQRSYK
jgi:succinate dehydrogenase / fumarate reductase flavoprotein subunit